MCQSNYNYGVLILFICFFVLWYDGIDITNTRYSHIDAHQYLAMSNGDTAVAPFGHRILGPLIVNNLPFENNNSFKIITIVSTILIIITFYYLLSMMQLNNTDIMYTLILFLGNKYLIGFLLWNYYQIADLLGFLALLLLFINLLKGKWLTFGIFFFLGVLSRETALIIIPSAFIFLLLKQSEQSKWNKFLLSIIPGITIFILMRILLDIPMEKSLLNQFFEGSHKWFYPTLRYTPAEVWFRTLINAWIPIGLLPIIFYSTTLTFLKKNKFLFLIVPSTLLSASFGYDNERLLLPMAIFIYPLICVILSQIKSNLIKILMILSMIISLPHHFMGFINTSNAVWTIGFSMLGLILTSAIGLFAKIKSKSI